VSRPTAAPYNRRVIDVVIVGGGPAGLLTAARLAECGLDVVLLEEHAHIGAPVHCTGIVSLEAAELAKISDDVVLGRLSRARFVGPGGVTAQHEWIGGEAILAIDRGAFDAELARHAGAAGAVIRTATRAHDVEVGGDGVVVHTAEAMVRARACVLACGVSYRFQRQLGLGLPGLAIHTAQTEVAAQPADAVEVHFGRGVAPDGFAWTVPVMRQGRARLKVGVMAAGNAGACLTRFLARPALRARLLEEPAPPVRRLLPLRPIARTFAERVLVVGDAGGFTKPTTGGGIFYSLLTATLAAETLVEEFAAGRLDEAALAAYAQRWQARLGGELRVADWLRTLVTRCSDAEIDRLVQALGAPDVHALVQRTARFNWHRDLIVALARQPRLATLLVRTLFR
jgi:digeranylgeranylglycerophospholipid reductase